MGKIKCVLGSWGNGKTEKIIEYTLEEAKKGKNCMFLTTEDYNHVLFKRCVSKLSENDESSLEKIDDILEKITFNRLHYSSNISHINSIIADSEDKFNVVCIDTANDLFSHPNYKVNNMVFSELRYMAELFDVDVIITIQLNKDGSIPSWLSMHSNEIEILCNLNKK